MQSTHKPYKLGYWIVAGAILGTFIGILISKLALGMIFGFFIGVMIDSYKRKSIAPPTEGSSDNQSNPMD